MGAVEFNTDTRLEFLRQYVCSNSINHLSVCECARLRSGENCFGRRSDDGDGEQPAAAELPGEGRLLTRTDRVIQFPIDATVTTTTTTANMRALTSVIVRPPE